MISKFDFPTSPNVIAEWRAIQLEPIINSGEKLTVLIILKDSYGGFQVHKAIDDKVIAQLFRKNSNNLLGLINYVAKSFKDILVNEWKPPFEGISASNWITAVDFSMDGILKQALLQSSSLHNFSTTHIQEHENQKESNSWQNDILDITASKHIYLRDYFNQKIELLSNVRYQYDFSHHNYISNFIDFTKLKGNGFQKPIFNLQLLRDAQITSKNIEIILHLPITDNTRLLNNNDLSEKVELIEYSLKNIIFHYLKLSQLKQLLIE